jgi:AraC-like DNA-binding protein
MIRPSDDPSRPVAHTLLLALRQVLASVAPDERLQIVSVATALGVGVRTLQRRLAESGLHFTGLVRQNRLDVGTRLLADTNAKVVDIALDLGYSDQSHFTRAFRRRTGLTPCEYRQQVERDRLSVRADADRDRTVGRSRGIERGTSRPEGMPATQRSLRKAPLDEPAIQTVRAIGLPQIEAVRHDMLRDPLALGRGWRT